MTTQLKKTVLAIALASCSLCINSTLADVQLPDEATAPAIPQERPEPFKPATSLLLQVQTSDTSSVTTSAMSETATALTNSAVVNAKTKREISAMLTNIVKSADNIVVITAPLMDSNASPAINSERLTINDDAYGHFRLFTNIPTTLTDKGKVAVDLQLLAAGHQGDQHDMNEAIAQTQIVVDPNNVLASEKAVRKFLKSQLHFGNSDHAQLAEGRPDIDMWIEVKNNDGSEGLKEGSNMVIYYLSSEDLYINLYLIGDGGDITRYIPSKYKSDNLMLANQVYRFPPKGDGFTVSGEGENKIRAIYTRIPSGVGLDMGGAMENGLQSRQQPIGVIPTQYPAVFATPDLANFFSLPESSFGEKDISFTIKAPTAQ